MDFFSLKISSLMCDSLKVKINQSSNKVPNSKAFSEGDDYILKNSLSTDQDRDFMGIFQILKNPFTTRFRQIMFKGKLLKQN